MSRVALIGTAGVAVALLLVGCTPSSPTTSSSPTASDGTPSASPSATPTTSSAPSIAPVAKSCAPDNASAPAGATSRKIGDIDGDDRADTEWISDSPSLRFGVTTASGATSSYALSSASPQPRQGFVTRLGNRVVSIVDDGRAAYLHLFVDCAWVTPKDSHGVQYTFDMQDLTGHGTGVGCSGDNVVGYQATKKSTGYTVTQTVINLNATGSLASNGATSTVVTNAAASDSRVKRAMTISCGSVTVANGGVSVGQ